MEEFDSQVGAVQPVTTDDLECLHNPSRAFREWVWDAFLTGRLDVFVAGVIRTGAAEDARTALQYLSRLSEDFPTPPSRLAVADFERRIPRGYRFRELKALVSAEPPTNSANLLLRHGSIGHDAVHALYTDKLLTPKKVVRKANDRARQLSLFLSEPVMEMSAQLPLYPRSRTRSFRLLRTIERLWLELAEAMAGGTENLLGEVDWSGWQGKRAAAARLRRSLLLLFGPHARKLEAINGDPRSTVHMLSFMSWASAVSLYRRQRSIRGRTLFREVPVLASAQGFGGGRIDALEVRSIGGHPPTGRQQRVLARIAEARQFRSSGELLRLLVDHFRRPLEIAVIDWKFLVGDVIITSHDWQCPNLEHEPLPEHVRQLSRYLTLIPVDCHLSDRQSEDVWHPRDITLTGVLVYFVPHRHPILHEVTMTADETEAQFIHEVVSKWKSASRRSAIRRLYNDMIGHLVHELSPTQTSSNGMRATHNGKNGSNGQHELFDLATLRSVRAVVEDHRQKVAVVVEGSHGLLEQHNGEGYELRYDKLLALIEAGTVSASAQFETNRGGKISCLFPDHQERTPSMQIYLDSGLPRFWCFGCCRGGSIALDSIPQQTFQLFADSWRRTEIGKRGWEQRQHHRLDLVVSEEHHRIMSTAQSLLAAAFRGSEGERYIQKARALDPDLAASYGAGYGTIDFIHGMLDAGFSFDELVAYGYLAFSHAITERSWVVQLLERRGIPRAEQFREIAVKGEKKKIPALPYLTLSRRVTFPLTLLGRTNNIYGRAVFDCDKHFVHRKLKVQNCSVKHGGFNMQVLEPDSGYSEVIVLEGVMDALTLIEYGQKNALAMIGVKNAAILTVVVQSGKTIATGLDLDATGRRKTAEITDLLAELGYRGDVSDFSTSFFKDETRYKDFNEWWKAHHLVSRIP